MNEDGRDHLRALLAAYTEVTGIELGLDFARRTTLREIDKKGLTPDDMRAVMRHLKSLVESTDKRFTESSLLFEVAVGVDKRVGKFESWAMMLRRTRQRAKRPAAPNSEATPVSEAEQERIRAAAKQHAEELQRKLYGGQAS